MISFASLCAPLLPLISSDSLICPVEFKCKVVSRVLRQKKIERLSRQYIGVSVMITHYRYSLLTTRSIATYSIAMRHLLRLGSLFVTKNVSCRNKVVAFNFSGFRGLQEVVIHKQENGKTSTTKSNQNKCGDEPVAKTSQEEEEEELEEMFIEGPVGLEWGGPTRGGRRPEPTRYGDWERKGRVSDFR